MYIVGLVWYTGTSRAIEEGKEDNLEPDRLQQTNAGGVPTRGPERQAAGPGCDPGAAVGAVSAGEQAPGLERDAERAEKPGWAAGEVPVEEGDRGAADGDKEAKGGGAEAAEPVYGYGEADREAVGEEEGVVSQLEEARDFGV